MAVFLLSLHLHPGGNQSAGEVEDGLRCESETESILVLLLLHQPDQRMDLSSPLHLLCPGGRLQSAWENIQSPSKLHLAFSTRTDCVDSGADYFDVQQQVGGELPRVVRHDSQDLQHDVR